MEAPGGQSNVFLCFLSKHLTYICQMNEQTSKNLSSFKSMHVNSEGLDPGMQPGSQCEYIPSTAPPGWRSCVLNVVWTSVSTTWLALADDKADVQPLTGQLSLWNGLQPGLRCSTLLASALDFIAPLQTQGLRDGRGVSCPPLEVPLPAPAERELTLWTRTLSFCFVLGTCWNPNTMLKGQKVSVKALASSLDSCPWEQWWAETLMSDVTL
jgi:hypothetical protein